MRSKGKQLMALFLTFALLGVGAACTKQEEPLLTGTDSTAGGTTTQTTTTQTTSETVSQTSGTGSTERAETTQLRATWHSIVITIPARRPTVKTTVKPKPKTTTKAGNKTTLKATTAQTEQSFASEVLRLCNAERKKMNLSPLKAGSAALQKAATTRAKEAAKRFSHTRPGGSQFYTAITEVKLQYRSCGENLAKYGSKAFTPKSLVEGWMNSPGHRANILSASYQYVSLGRSGNSYSQLFFTPL